MELRQLRCFIVLAEELHFGRAADRLRIAQPSLSTQIQALEATMGTRLLSRTQRSVSLTTAGELFLQEARNTIAQADRAISIGRLAGRGEIGTLRIAMAVGTSLSGVPSEIMACYRKRFPEIDLQLTLMSTNDQLEGLQHNTIDIGFLVLPSKTVSNIGNIKLASNNLTIALPEDSPLARFDTLAAADLAGEPFLVLNSKASPGIQESTQLLGRFGGFSPHIVRIENDLLALLSLVSAGVGVVVLADSVCRIHMPKVAYRAVVDFSMSIELDVAYRSNDATRATKAFLDECRSYISERQ
jgi:DNA-binding transcriptional LysR family regulator